MDGCDAHCTAALNPVGTVLLRSLLSVPCCPQPGRPDDAPERHGLDRLDEEGVEEYEPGSGGGATADVWEGVAGGDVL